MAEGISKEVKIKAASKALTNQLVNLIGVIDPLMMAANLISKEIIDRSILERVILPISTKNEKACEVITAVSDAVMINPDYFAIFCDILDNEPVTKDIAKILKGRRKHCLRFHKMACFKLAFTLISQKNIKKSFVQLRKFHVSCHFVSLH